MKIVIIGDGLREFALQSDLLQNGFDNLRTRFVDEYSKARYLKTESDFFEEYFRQKKIKKGNLQRNLFFALNEKNSDGEIDLIIFIK